MIRKRMKSMCWKRWKNVVNKLMSWVLDWKLRESNLKIFMKI